MARNPEETFKNILVRKVLLVCLGNICRSPLAEYLLRDQLRKADIVDIQVSSAGLLDMEGREPAPDIVRILAEHGIDMAGHRSRKLSGQMILENDLVVVMETGQREEIVRALPAIAGKVWLLSEFSLVPEERDIPDPYGKEDFHYRACYKDVYFLVEGLTRFLIQNRRSSGG